MDIPHGLVVDIHSHIYPPSYIKLLKERTTPPQIIGTSDGDRLLILPAEANNSSTSSGRPVGPSYYDVSQKLLFMEQHNITISVLSLANPWLDWVPAAKAAETAVLINNEIDDLCLQYPGRLFAFATLPLTGSKPCILREIERVKALSCIRGVVLGTTGLGKGLDDPALLHIFLALQDAKLPIFLHPHYGLPSSLWGERADEYGHVLPLALGFPMETTIAVTRMILGGVFDKVPELQVIVAHAGGTLPFLTARVESCIRHDGYLFDKDGSGSIGMKTVRQIMEENIWLDAVVYGATGIKAAIELVGVDKVMFGTDHPFFPPLQKPTGKAEDRWESVRSNLRGIEGAVGTDSEQINLLLGRNATRFLQLEA